MSNRLRIIALLSSVVTAHAGVLIVEQTKDLRRAGATTTATVSVGEHDLMIKSTGSDGDQLVVYRGAEQALYMANLKNGTYRRITKQQIEGMMGGVNDQMAQMRAQMAEKLQGMDPQKRKMIEDMMNQRMGGGAAMGSEPVKTIYRKVASGEKIGERICDKYEGYRAEEKVSEIWAVDWSEFGLNQDDFRVLLDLTEMFSSLSSRMDSDFFRIGAKARSETEYSGVPVQRITFRDGKPSNQHNVLEVTKTSFGPETFTLPDNLTEDTTAMFGKRP